MQEIANSDLDVARYAKAVLKGEARTNGGPRLHQVAPRLR